MKTILGELCTTPFPVYLDGSGSTQGMWDKPGALELLHSRFDSGLPTYWTDPAGLLNLQGYWDPPLRGTDFGAAIYDRKNNRVAAHGFIVTDDPSTALRQTATESDRWTIVTLKELENSMSCKCKTNCRCQLEEAVADLEYKTSRLFADYDNGPARNREGISIHTKLDRLTKDVEDLDQSVPANKVLRRRLLVLADRLLVDVFGIDPDKVTNTSAPKVTSEVPEIDPTKGFQVTSAIQYMNDDVAAVEYNLCMNSKIIQTFIGSAKRNPVDKADQVTGLLVANAKAFHQMARFFDRAAKERLAVAEAEVRREAHEKAQRRADARKLQSAARARRTQKWLQDENARLKAEMAKAKAPAKKAPVKRAPAKKA